MNLTDQFPDISPEIREKARRQKTRARSVGVRREKTIGKTYDHVFRRWHVKVLLIIILLLGSTYLVVLNSPWIFHLIN